MSQTANRNAARLMAGHHPIGVSTGIFDDLRNAWRPLVLAACGVSTYAAELSALSEDELPGLIAYLNQKPRLPFRYLSVHAPVKNRSMDDIATAQLLDGFPLSVRSIVTHPDALRDFAPYRDLGTRLVLENMDERKRAGRTADELEAIFDALPDAGFCFDVAHAHSIDPTMSAAHDLIDRFPARLRQVHLSSLADGHHVPLTRADEHLFASVLDRCRDVPWILEARPPARWLGELKTADMIAVG